MVQPLLYSRCCFENVDQFCFPMTRVPFARALNEFHQGIFCRACVTALNSKRAVEVMLTIDGVLYFTRIEADDTPGQVALTFRYIC